MKMDLEGAAVGDRRMNVADATPAVAAWEGVLRLE
jgi:hypothetical protein